MDGARDGPQPLAPYGGCEPPGSDGGSGLKPAPVPTEVAGGAVAAVATEAVPGAIAVAAAPSQLAAVWPGHYRSPLWRRAVRLKVRGVEPEQLPARFRTALSNAAAAARLRLRAVAVWRGCIEVSLLLEGVALPPPTAWQRGGAPPEPDAAGGREPDWALDTSAVVEALGLPAGGRRVVREPDQLITAGPAAARGRGAGDGFSRLSSEGFGPPPLPLAARVAPRILLLQPPPVAVEVEGEGEGEGLYPKGGYESRSPSGTLAQLPFAPLRLSLWISAALADADDPATPEAPPGLAPSATGEGSLPADAAAGDAAPAVGMESEEFLSAESAAVEEGGPTLASRAGAVEVVLVASHRLLPLSVELRNLPHGRSAAGAAAGEGVGEGLVPGAAAGMVVAGAGGQAAAHAEEDVEAEYGVELLAPPPGPGPVLLELCLRKRGGLPPTPPRRRATVPLVALGPADAPMAAELAAVVAGWPKDAYEELDELLYDIGTWVATTAAATADTAAETAAESGSDGLADADLWVALGPHLLHYADAAGWSTTAARIRADLRAAPPAATRALCDAGWGLLTSASGTTAAGNVPRWPLMSSESMAGSQGRTGSAGGSEVDSRGSGRRRWPWPVAALLRELELVRGPAPSGRGSGGGAAAAAAAGSEASSAHEEREEEARQAEAAFRAFAEQRAVELCGWGQLAEGVLLLAALAFFALLGSGEPPGPGAQVALAGVAACGGGALLAAARLFMPPQRWARLVGKARMTRYGGHVVARGLAALSVAAAAGGGGGRVPLVLILAALVMADGVLLPLACMLPPRSVLGMGAMRFIFNAVALAALAEPRLGLAAAAAAAAVEAAALATSVAAFATLRASYERRQALGLGIGGGAAPEAAAAAAQQQGSGDAGAGPSTSKGAKYD
ncbi:hypothetical protein HYH03_010568 [Edaphochlamys debaryana]|uniref:Uncharacterized protein n=1 Tax=Edaphochlamys debaryana TaxID=47281 RepID=A0A836BXF6_9CHLO|nr:hypothetical protein HYH03_010568 [Edaphochlamys debaryana]|eukprot:KAG2491124.1 hypothetical protein HYH03_010568 [Edaphochlamys debaryana]